MIVTCPRCGTSHLEHHSLLGKRVPCPGCGVPFDVPVPALATVAVTAFVVVVVWFAVYCGGVLGLF